ncbi:MAG: DUF3806 domain-containing protein [Erythrobacter sp.]|uniref:DUF3806 domain-containing protein n=1 Tax=Erythrobacter sp. TaxID=1042 RepID=UPI003A889AFD
MTFKISQLSERQVQDLRSSFARLGDQFNGAKFVTVDAIQSTYDALLASPEWDEDRVTALGVAFGEMICAHGDFEWVRVEDEYGTGPALAPIGFDIVCSPIDMIEKRLEDREVVDLSDLCSDTIAAIEGIIEAGDAGPRVT